MPFTMDDLETLRRALSELPANRPRIVSKQNAVAELVTELTAAQRRGYSVEDLAQLLASKGLSLTPGTLRGYLRRMRKKRRPLKKGEPASKVVAPMLAVGDGGGGSPGQHHASAHGQQSSASAQIPGAGSDSNGHGRGAESSAGKGTVGVAPPPRPGTRGTGNT